MPGHESDDGVSRTVHAGRGGHEADAVYRFVPPAPMTVKSQRRPPAGTVNGAVPITPLRQSKSIGASPVHSAWQRVELRHVHVAVVCAPHATSVGLNRTSHVGCGEHAADALIIVLPASFRAVKTQFNPPMGTGKGTVTGAPAPQSSIG